MMTGGGTLGPVTPLIAIAEAWEKIDPAVEFVWIGTPDGPERGLLEKLGYRFIGVKSAKLPRYASLSVLIAPVVFLRSFYQARDIIRAERPDIIMSAGGYVSVPFVWAGKILGIPSWIHQLDVRPGLANKLMASFATRISTSWQKTVEFFPAEKTVWMGNPVREDLAKTERDRAYHDFELDPDFPTILVIGGGGGAKWINDAMQGIGPDLTEKMNVIHQTGKGKDTAELESIGGRYHGREFIFNMDQAYAAADIVICRAGMGTISELAFLKKASIVIPIPNSHQEDNAAVLNENKAAIIFNQAMAPGLLAEKITNLLDNPEKMREMGNNISQILPTEGVATKIAQQARVLAFGK